MLLQKKYLLAINTYGAYRSTNCLLAYIFKSGPSPDVSLPLERVKWISALKQLRDAELPAAEQSLSEIATHDPKSVIQLESSCLLVRCFLSQGKLAGAAELAARLFVKSSYFVSVLPITELVGGLLTHHDEPLITSSTRGLLSVAIVFDLYSRHVSSDRDAERADAYRDVLVRYEADRASGLVAAPTDELIYFLRYVCVPDVLDQSLALSKTKDVEDERIAILRRLIEMMTSPGKLPPPEIKEELQEITTRQAPTTPACVKIGTGLD
jgi:hypothetical protein